MDKTEITAGAIVIARSHVSVTDLSQFHHGGIATVIPSNGNSGIAWIE